MAGWFHHAMLELRDYANEGGKLIVAGRNVHQAPTSTSTGLVGHRPVHVDAGQAVRLLLPGQQRRRRRPARARRSSARATTSNDTWQNYLGVVGRSGGIGSVTHGTVARRRAGRPEGRRPVRRHGADRRRRDGGQRPEPERRRHPAAAGQDPAAPAQLGRGRRTNEPLRQERSQADYTTTPAQNATGGAIISTRDSRDVRLRSRAGRRDHAHRAAQAQPQLPAADHGRTPRRRRSSASSTRPTTPGDAGGPGRGSRSPRTTSAAT